MAKLSIGQNRSLPDLQQAGDPLRWQGQDHSVIVQAGKAKGHRFNYCQTLCLNVLF